MTTDNVFTLIAACGLFALGIVCIFGCFRLYHKVQLQVCHVISTATLVVGGLLLGICALAWPDKLHYIHLPMIGIGLLSLAVKNTETVERFLRKPILPNSKDVRRF